MVHAVSGWRVHDDSKPAATGSRSRGGPSPQKGSRDRPGLHRLLPVSCDITSPAEVDRGFTEIEQVLGPVQVLVCAAGITDDTLLLRMSEERWDNVIQTNLTGVYRTVKRALGPMVRARQGRIVLISSVVAFMGSTGQVNYGASKAALVGFARSLAREVASRSITVNVVAPGFVATDMIAVLGEDRVAAPDVHGAARAPSCPRRGRLGRRVPSRRRCQLRDRRRTGRGRWPRNGPSDSSHQPTDERKQPHAWTTKRRSRSSRPVRSRS